MAKVVLCEARPATFFLLIESVSSYNIVKPANTTVKNRLPCRLCT